VGTLWHMRLVKWSASAASGRMFLSMWCESQLPLATPLEREGCLRVLMHNARTFPHMMHVFRTDASLDSTDGCPGANVLQPARSKRLQFTSDKPQYKTFASAGPPAKCLNHTNRQARQLPLVGSGTLWAPRAPAPAPRPLGP